MKKNGIAILLVEDHAFVREGVRELLARQEDMRVVGETATGEDAVRLAKETQPDVVLMDIALPGINGIEATRQIKQALPATAVLVLTAYDNEEFVLAILDAGAAGYLLKNVRSQELLHAIRSVHEGECVLHPAIVRKALGRPKETAEPATKTKGGTTLSRREMEVVELGAGGLLNKEIAQRLSLGERTIQTHWRNIFNKLGVGSRVEAIMVCLRKRWISVGDQ